MHVIVKINNYFYNADLHHAQSCMVMDTGKLNASGQFHSSTHKSTKFGCVVDLQPYWGYGQLKSPDFLFILITVTHKAI